VDTRIFVRRLRDGDCRAFQEAVLHTRPDGGALWWRVPISARFAESETVTSPEVAMISRLPGMMIQRNTYPIGDGAAQVPGTVRGGVSADIPVSDRDVRKK
jgi:hypothetical protein